MTKKGKLFTGFVVLVLLWMLMLFFNWHRIEKELKSGSVAVLDQAGHGHLSVETDHRGRTVSLSGVMRSQKDIDHAESLVEAIEGVQIVQTDAIALKPYKATSISLSSNGSAMTLLGSMSSGRAADQFSGQVTKAMGMPLDHGLNIDPSVESPQWLTGLATAMPSLKPIENLQLEIQERRLRIAGISRNAAVHQAALNAVGNLPGIESVDSTELIIRPFNPSWFELSSGVVSGTVSNQADANRLQEMLSGVVSSHKGGKIGVDSEFSEAGWLIDLGKIAKNANGVESPAISYRDGVIRVAGVVRNQGAFDAIAAQAPSLTHTRQLNLSGLELRPFEMPWINLQVIKDKIVLQGLVSDQATVDQILQQVVDAIDPEFSRVIENQMQPSKDASPAKWAASMSGLLAGMVAVEEGNLSLRDGVLALSGIAREEPLFNQLQADSAASGVADIVDSSKLAYRPWKAPRFAVSTFGSKAVVSGRVGSSQDASILGEAIGLVFGASGSTQILVDPDVTEAFWLNDLMRLMPALTGLENGSLTASDERIDIEGVARTQASYELLANAVSESSAKQIRNDVSLRPWQQPSLEISSTSALLIATGSMPDEESLRRINAQLSALSEAKGLPVEFTVAVGFDVQNTPWLDPLIQAIPTLSELDNPGLRVTDGLMTLSGQVSYVATMDSVFSAMSNAAGELNVQNDIVVISPVVIETGAGSVGIAQEEIDRCEENLDAQMVGRNIEFALSSALLSATSAPLLIALVGELENCPAVIVEVSGHTDSTGNSANNLLLSDSRAQAVVDYLVAAGIPANRLEAEGYGSTRPIADNQTAAGRATNRRIEFNIKTKR